MALRRYMATNPWGMERFIPNYLRAPLNILAPKYLGAFSPKFCSIDRKIWAINTDKFSFSGLNPGEEYFCLFLLSADKFMLNFRKNVGKNLGQNFSFFPKLRSGNF